MLSCMEEAQYPLPVQALIEPPTPEPKPRPLCDFDICAVCVCVFVSGLQAAAMSVKTGTDGAPLLSAAGGMVLIYAHVLSLKSYFLLSHCDTLSFLF